MGLHVHATSGDDEETMPPHHHQIPEDSLQRSKGSCTSGSWQKRQDSAFQDSSKDWIFHGTVAIHNTVDWDHSDVAEDRCMLAERLTESFADCGQSIKRSLSDHAPASIDCAVIISNIYDVTDDLQHGEPMMGMPIRGYVATSTRVHQKAWKESNTLCEVFGTPLTWTKITGGIRSWPKFNND
jgi:hypothetical protein